MQLDTRGNDFSESDRQIFNKSDQWLGAAMSSGGPNGSLVICRPRYQYYFYRSNGLQQQQRDLLGGCFVLTQEDFDHPNILLPCITGGDRRCQFGFSVDAKKDHIVYGAVGLGRQEGQFWRSDSRGEQRQKRPKRKVGVTRENNYRGYTVASGDFKGDSNPEYAIAVPRHKQAFGKVVLYDSDLNEYNDLENSDMGSYFGHTLVTSDLNNDGYDDLVVCAPLFTDSISNNGSLWEIGKVFIYYNDRNGGFGYADTITGRDVGGRFGYAATSLGDINVDGFNDLAISAPFIDKGNRGKVFIYHGIGHNARLPLTPVQVLESRQFGQALVPFGCALSAGVDVDSNSYPDLAVGAYRSQVAVVYRSRPSFTASMQVFHEPRFLDLDILDHLLPDGTLTTRMDLNVCFSFVGLGLPKSIVIGYNITLDAAKSQSPRMAFMESRSATLQSTIVASTESTMHCTQHKVYIQPSIVDKQTAISVICTYDYLEDQQATWTPDGYLIPVLSRWAVTRSAFSVPLKRNCANETCFPNLVISPKAETDYLIAGDNGETSIRVDIENHGEDSFYSTLEIRIPDEINFSKLDRTVTDSIVTCSVTRRVVVCHIGNPLKAGGKVNMRICFQTEDLSVTESEVIFAMTAKSGDDELEHHSEDNHANISIPVFSSSNITLRGEVNQELLLFKETDYPLNRVVEFQNDIGPLITYTISLVNRGPSPLGPTELVLSWPTFPVLNGQLLYPISAITDDDGDCYVINGQWNPENLTTTFGNYIRGRRHRRDGPLSTSSQTRIASPLLSSQLKSLACRSSLSPCDKIVCYVDTLARGRHSERDEVVVIVTARLKTDLLVKYNITGFKLMTRVEALVKDSLHPSTPFLNLPTADIEISTTVLGEIDQPQPHIPYWVYIVAIAGGLFIQLVVIIILQKTGFFKRKKISPKQRECLSLEKEPVVLLSATPLERNSLTSPMQRNPLSCDKLFDIDNRRS
nr:integrin alpha pat-2-like [Lytechinus pictus]